LRKVKHEPGLSKTSAPNLSRRHSGDQKLTTPGSQSTSFLGTSRGPALAVQPRHDVSTTDLHRTGSPERRDFSPPRLAPQVVRRTPSGPSPSRSTWSSQVMRVTSDGRSLPQPGTGRLQDTSPVRRSGFSPPPMRPPSPSRVHGSAVAPPPMTVSGWGSPRSVSTGFPQGASVSAHPFRPLPTRKPSFTSFDAPAATSSILCAGGGLHVPMPASPRLSHRASSPPRQRASSPPPVQLSYTPMLSPRPGSSLTVMPGGVPPSGTPSSPAGTASLQVPKWSRKPSVQDLMASWPPQPSWGTGFQKIARPGSVQASALPSHVPEAALSAVPQVEWQDIVSARERYQGRCLTEDKLRGWLATIPTSGSGPQRDWDDSQIMNLVTFAQDAQLENLSAEDIYRQYVISQVELAENSQ